MTSIKKLAATVAAAICIGGVGLTAYADAADFSFSLHLDEEWYFQNTDLIRKTDLWSKPAVVEIKGGNLSASNKAEVAVSSDYNWPESATITDYKEVKGCYTYTLKYDDKYAGKRPSNREVCLLARTLGGETDFYGEWEA